MKNFKSFLFLWFIKLCLAWVIFALTFQVSMLVLSFINPRLEKKISNEITWKFDGTFNK